MKKPISHMIDRILVIDDHRAIHDDFRKILEADCDYNSELQATEARLFGEVAEARQQDRFRVDSAYQGQDGVELVRRAVQEKSPYAMAFVDMRMPPGCDGVEAIAKIWELDPDLQAVICTAYSDQSWGEINRRIGGSDRLLILKKPFDLIEVLQLAYALTEKRRLLQTSRRRMDEQALFLDQAAEAICLRDLEDRILYWNQGAEILYGWTKAEAVGKNVGLILGGSLSPELVEANQQVIEHGKWNGELREVSKDGREMTVESRWTLVRDDGGKPKSKLVISMDVTKKKMLEAQHLQSQRMASLGTLAGGIAHELNNVLTPLMVSLQLLQQRFPDEASQQLLKILANSAQRGSDIVRQVLSFVRKGDGQRTEVQIGSLLQETERILAHTFPKAIEIVSQIAGDLWIVAADPTQLHQILMNLCVNARDAMPNGGQLILTAENAVVEEGPSHCYPDAKPGKYVVISIADNGMGIPPSQIDRIFDPFFTTKDIGKGTGLGLSTTLGIVRNHDGFISVDSKLDRGSCFRVYLPANISATAKTPPKTALPSIEGHGETILLVDDEAFILEITRQALEDQGYRVLTASDGVEALAVYVREQSTIAVVLIDMMMPLMDGATTIRALRKIDPQVRVIASSGFMDEPKDGELNAGTGMGIQALLPKPYEASQLFATLSRVLRAV